MSVSFVLGNGTSRLGINHKLLNEYGTVYGCNALYREFSPDYLVAVDSKMIFEIHSKGYQHRGNVWTNRNKIYKNFEGFNYFEKSKGWSSGPTALHLASTHAPKVVYILGFDYAGLQDGKLLNNVYADTENYKKSSDKATYHGNWLRQTATVIKENQNISYFRVIQSDNIIPEQLNNFVNLKHIIVEDFHKIFPKSANF